MTKRTQISRLTLPEVEIKDVVTSTLKNGKSLSSNIVKEDKDAIESAVKLITLDNGVFCLSHSIRQQQIFGGKILRDAYIHLIEGNSNKIPSKLKKALLDFGFSVGKGQNTLRVHKAVLEEEDKKINNKASFTMLRILLTDVCNLGCSYCKVIPNVNAPHRKPTESNRLEDVIQMFFQNSVENEPKLIHITGGEPTLYKDKIKEIISIAEKYSRTNENFWYVLGTNAVLIDESFAKFCAEKNIKCIVSMDSHNAQTNDLLRPNLGGKGSWAKVDNGIRKLKEAGAEVSISAVIGKHSIDELYESIDFYIDQYQPTGMGVNFMKPPTPDQLDYPYLLDPNLYADTLYDIHKKYRNTSGLFLELVMRHLEPFVTREVRYHDCGAAGGNNINIDADGNIGPCKSFLVMDKLALEEINPEIYKDTVISSWRKRSPIYFNHCSSCNAIAMCGNGCAYEAYIHTGEDMALDMRACAYTQRFNELMLIDLSEQVINNNPDDDYWIIPSQKDRESLLGNVRSLPDSLSFSVGHHTHRSNQSPLPQHVQSNADKIVHYDQRIGRDFQ